jgi:hypothetical protein
MHKFFKINLGLLLFVLGTYNFNACISAKEMNDKMEKPICNDVNTKPEYLGKSFQVIKESKGSPQSEETFSMKDAIINEFRGKLEVLFPRSKPEYQSVVIKEATWHDQDCRLTLWFKKVKDGWVVVDTLYWHKGTEF